MATALQHPAPSIDGYHQSFDRDSNSSLQLFRESVAEYAAIRVFQTLPPREPTPEMELGTAFHCLVLEPDLFKQRYTVAPKFDRRTKDGKAAYAEWQADNADKTPLAIEDYKLIHAMADGLRRNTRARASVEVAGEAERVVLWDDPDTGCPLKMRADRILANEIIVDLKTTNDVRPDSWARTVHNLGYYRQAALYQAGVRVALGIDCEVVFVAVSKRPPHETGCFVLDADAIRLGHAENEATIRELVERRATGNWESRLHGQVIQVGLPRWAYTR